MAGHVNEFIGTVLWKDQGKLAFTFKTGLTALNSEGSGRVSSCRAKLRLRFGLLG